MKTRMLTPEEWSKLDATCMPQVAPLLPPGDVQVVGVEIDGQLAGCVTLYRATHWEGTWISPKHRNAGVTRALLRGAREAAQNLGSAWAFVDTTDREAAMLAERLGAVLTKVDTYLLPLGD